MLIKTLLFKDFVHFFGPSKFTNVTNGVTPRRYIFCNIFSWVHQANPKLSSMITRLLGSELWLKDLSQLSNLKAFADDPKIQKEWMGIKHENKVIFIKFKVHLASYILQTCNIVVSPDAMFDIHVICFILV